MAEDGKDQTNSSNIDKVSLLLKACSAFHLVEGYKYVMQISNHTKTTVLTILKKADTGSVKGNWLLRFDKAHAGADFPHLNIRHRFTGIQDPHLKLPPGTLSVAKSGGYVCKALNYLSDIALIIDACRLGTSIKTDYKNGTISNTVDCATDISLTWTGGFVGASVGAGLGTLCLPVVGTMVLAATGSISGVLLGRSLANRLIQKWHRVEPEAGPYVRPWDYFCIGRAQ